MRRTGRRSGDQDVLREFTADFRGPVLFNFPSGHTAGRRGRCRSASRRSRREPSPVVRILEAAVE
jgi:hypothetical protein